MPAAAVIPAPIAYIKVVAVKTLVVGLWTRVAGLPIGEYWLGGSHFLAEWCALHWVCHSGQNFYFEKIRVFKTCFTREYISME